MHVIYSVFVCYVFSHLIYYFVITVSLFMLLIIFGQWDNPVGGATVAMLCIRPQRVGGEVNMSCTYWYNLHTWLSFTFWISDP